MPNCVLRCCEFDFHEWAHRTFPTPSAICFAPGVYFKNAIPRFIISRIQCTCVSICFVRAWNSGLLANKLRYCCHSKAWLVRFDNQSGKVHPEWKGSKSNPFLLYIHEILEPCALIWCCAGAILARLVFLTRIFLGNPQDVPFF